MKTYYFEVIYPASCTAIRVQVPAPSNQEAANLIGEALKVIPGAKVRVDQDVDEVREADHE